MKKALIYRLESEFATQFKEGGNWFISLFAW